jgi:hypothetical protein
LNNLTGAAFQFPGIAWQILVCERQSKFCRDARFCYFMGTKMKSFIHYKLWPVAVGSVLMIAAAGCGRDSVKVYHVDSNDTAVVTPASVSAPSAMPATMPNGMAVPDSGIHPQLKYTLPAGWKEKPLTQLRAASFEVSENGKTADVSVIPLGGMSGGNAANVNRWRGQVGLPPLSDTELAQLAEKVEAAGMPADLYDIAGTSPGSSDDERIIGTILHSDNAVWFFKMTGDSALVETNKAAFIAFMKSVQFGELAAPSTMDLSQLPPSHPPIPGMTPSASTAAAASDKPTWTVPAGWQEGPLEQFLVAKYVIAGDGGAQAAVNVSLLAGDGGGLLANVNRWRAQLGLAPVSDADVANLPTLDASGGKATVIDFPGTDARTGQPARLVGVVLPLGGQTWFYKLMGDATVVAQQKDALIQFVQSAKYPAGQ